MALGPLTIGILLRHNPYNGVTASPLDCTVDIIFMLDESGSIGLNDDFVLMKSFLSHLVGRLDIDSGNTRVGLATYSAYVGTTINLNEYTSVASLQSKISSLYPSRGGTDTAAALSYVRTEMLTAAAGDRINVPNVVVVLTDGGSFSLSSTRVS